jgi:hypothetical protein
MAVQMGSGYWGGSVVYLSVVFKVVHIHVDLIEELSSNRIIPALREMHTMSKVPSAQMQANRHIRQLRRTVPETVVIQPDIALLNPQPSAISPSYPQRKDT